MLLSKYYLSIFSKIYLELGEKTSGGSGIGTPGAITVANPLAFTDEQSYFISESSAFRILKCFDLVQSPAFKVLSTVGKFEHPLRCFFWIRDSAMLFRYWRG